MSPEEQGKTISRKNKNIVDDNGTIMVTNKASASEWRKHV